MQISVELALRHGHRRWNEPCLLQWRIVKSLMSSLLKPGDRDIPKRAEVQTKSDVQKCAVFVKLFDRNVPAYLWLVCSESTRTWTRRIHFGLKEKTKTNNKTRVFGNYCSACSGRRSEPVTEPRTRNLKLSEGSVQTVTTTRKRGCGGARLWKQQFTLILSGTSLTGSHE